MDFCSLGCLQVEDNSL
jgi:hypothetical protein